MRTIIKITIACFTMLLVQDCALFDSGSDNVVDNYKVQWVDTKDSRGLSNTEEIVPAYVFAVGHNYKFIFTKQHPLSFNTRKKIDTSITNYYIIERTLSDHQDKPTYGPLTKRGFDSLCTRFGIKNPAFDMTYPTGF